MEEGNKEMGLKILRARCFYKKVGDRKTCKLLYLGEVWDLAAHGPEVGFYLCL